MHIPSDTLNFREMNTAKSIADSDSEQLQDYVSKSNFGKDVKAQPCEGTLSELFSDPSLVRNLLVITTLWTCASFSIYLTNFMLKSVQGDYWINYVVSAISVIVGKGLCFYMRQKFSTKDSLFYSYVIGLIGAIPVAFSETAGEEFQLVAVPVCIFIFGVGNAAAFMLLYAGHL